MLKIINTIITQTNLLPQQAWWLLEFVTNKSKSQLLTQKETLSHEEQAKLAAYVQQITEEDKPLAYILGSMPFLNLQLKIQPPILIPRPETESWVAQLLEILKPFSSEKITILDIGTGSGCIALALAQAFPNFIIYGIDISDQAISLAQENAQLHSINNVTFITSDLFSKLTNLQFDLIVSNPPYINPTAQLEKSVFAWEDHNALFAPNEGLQIIEQIIQQAPKYLKKNNLPWRLVMEIDASQGKIVEQICIQNNFIKIKIEQDQFARDRTVWVE
ncbi:MAG: peptide chain release factor N(5)-glutamine methyltransferase [Candidatus Chromulinivorax sp.]